MPKAPQAEAPQVAVEAEELCNILRQAHDSGKTAFIPLVSAAKARSLRRQLYRLAETFNESGRWYYARTRFRVVGRILYIEPKPVWAEQLGLVVFKEHVDASSSEGKIPPSNRLDDKS